MAQSKISKVLIQNSKKKLFIRQTPQQFVIEKRFQILLFFHILQFHGNFFHDSLWNFSCFRFFRLCTTAACVQLPHNMVCCCFLLFNRVELLCPLTTICLSFSFSRFMEYSCFRFLVCAPSRCLQPHNTEMIIVVVFLF